MGWRHRLMSVLLLTKKETEKPVFLETLVGSARGWCWISMGVGTEEELEPGNHKYKDYLNTSFLIYVRVHARSYRI